MEQLTDLPVFSGKRSAFQNWNSVLQQSGHVTVETWNTGNLKIPPTGMMNFEHPATAQLDREPFYLPVNVFLIQHPQYGDFLVDAGLDRAFTDPLHWPAYPSQQQPNQPIASRLAAKNIDLKGIFFTHLDQDHWYGILDLNPVPPCVAASDVSGLADLQQKASFRTLDFSKAESLTPFEKCIDIFGDGSFWAIATPGHTHGHTSFLAFTAEAPVLMCGDACYLRWQFENGIEPGWTEDRAQAVQSLAQLRKFAELFPQVQLRFSHES